ncbi:MAG: hypothetical protein ACR2PL_07410, partial [Dehalococcoidia bacterium]
MEHSYWARRSSRRGVLRATGLGTACIAAVLICCGRSSNSKAGPTNSKAATTAATSGAGQAKRGGIFLGGLGNEVPHLDVHAGNWPIG